MLITKFKNVQQCRKIVHTDEYVVLKRCLFLCFFLVKCVVFKMLWRFAGILFRGVVKWVWSSCGLSDVCVRVISRTCCLLLLHLTFKRVTGTGASTNKVK